RQENGLKTVTEVNDELNKIAQELGLDNFNDLTVDNLSNLKKAEAERNHARNSLRTNNLNTLPQIPANETLQTLLDRPTQQELDQVKKDKNELGEKNKILSDENNNLQNQIINKNSTISAKDEVIADLDADKQKLETDKSQLENKLKDFINPNDKNKLEKVAKDAGFGFTQKDIDEAVQKEKEN
ncbi:20_t:CDS:1, partial [Paraglomus occultum]